jgi:glycosyltransferase involved in cell wall biosynthesis
VKLSAVLAVRDEEPMLDACLRLLGFCDEVVVVVDSRTSDATEQIARRHTDRVFVREFDNFSGQKNFAIEQAGGDWVLIVDADERITPALAQEIQETLTEDPPYDAFWIETINVFLGTRMKHGGWEEHHVRLVRRSVARYSGDLHESFAIAPKRLGRLREGMLHFSHRSVLDNLVKSANYIDVDVQAMLAAGHKPVRARTLFWVIFKEFANRFVYRRGYRDGMVGVIESLYQPFARFCLYVLLWERQQKPSISERYAELDRQAAERR